MEPGDFYMYNHDCPWYQEGMCKVYGFCNETECAIIFWLKKILGED